MPSTTLHAAPVAAVPDQQGYPSPAVVAALFCGYLAVGLPLPVLPLFIHDRLGFGNVAVGLVIGIQFLATVLTRGLAGRIADQHGGKRAVLLGTMWAAFAGVLYVVAVLPQLAPRASLAVLLAGRIAAGLGESQFVTGGVAWAIASVGPRRAGMAMSWTGIAMYAALALGAPVGLALYAEYGPAAALLSCVVAPLLAAGLALRTRAHTAPPGPRLPFSAVLAQIWREGLGLMLQGVGLAGLTAFAALYFAERHWGHAGLVMTAFGTGYIAVRLLLGHLPDSIGGYRVALWSMGVEVAGQLLLWIAPSAGAALAGALVTGMGCALIFPALGVEILKRVPPASRGSALGGFVAFLDVAYGVAGPAAGLVAGRFGYAAVYLFGAMCALAGFAITLVLRSTRP